MDPRLRGEAQEQKAARPLSSTAAGEVVEIHSIEAGRGLQSRLSAMGLLPGVSVRILRNSRGGPVVIAVKDSRVMLGRGAAHKVMVR